jgi:hypothetical protein
VPVHEGGTPLVRKLPAQAAARPPDGEPLYAGDRTVVLAWQARARRERRMGRVAAVSAAVLAAVATSAEVVPSVAALAAIAGAAALYPLHSVATGSRAAQRAFEVHESGVWGTQRRQLLRFRRFVRWQDFAHATARQVAPGRFHLEVHLLSGAVLSSIPGELSREAVDFVHERCGHQVRFE